MPTNTSKFNLVKPLKSENYNVDQFNTNADIIDSQIYSKSEVDVALNNKVPYHLLKSSENLQTILNNGNRLIHLNPVETYVMNGIVLPSGTKIYGNGATITSSNTNLPVFKIGGTTPISDVLIHDIKFRGATLDTNNQVAIGTDIAIQLIKAYRTIIRGCRFEHFLGAGISVSDMQSTVGWSRERQNTIITNNTFQYCYIGFAHWLNAEYGLFSDNIVNDCRVGVWGQSGNWSIVNNIILRCRCAIVGTSSLNAVVTSCGTNLLHGTITGNSFNHNMASQATTWNTSNFLIGGVDYVGIYIDGTDGGIPSLFSANSIWYTNLMYINSALSGLALWKITGCVFSNCTISSDVATTLVLVGCSEFNLVTKTNVSELVSPISAILPFTLINSWTQNTGIAPVLGYTIEENGFVSLHGAVSPGTAATLGTLPIGARPPYDAVYFACASNVGYIRVGVTRAGTIVVTSTAVTWVALDGVRFRTKI